MTGRKGLGIKGYISEIFGSFQGEGPFIGERHVFVRFCRCRLGCAYCDTPASRTESPYARLEAGPGMADTVVPNPVTAAMVAGAVDAAQGRPGLCAKVSVTGGEPLEQPEFLRAVLAELGGRLPVLLETNGVHAEAFSGVSDLVDTVSMDVKLPSVSGLGPLWERHADFISACRGRELIVKAVVSADTGKEELGLAAGLVADKAPEALFVIQPLSGGDGLPAVDGKVLLGLYEAAREHIVKVRVIPQVHRILGVR